MSDSGHPSRFGYVQCAWCGAWRPDGATFTASERGPACLDEDWCHDQYLKRELAAAAVRQCLAVGWDANGAPTEVP